MFDAAKNQEILEKYEKLYDELKDITLRDTMILTTRSDREDVKDFYQTLENYFIARRQKDTIQRRVY